MVADVLAAKAATALFGVDFGKSGNIGGLVGKGLTWLTSGGGGGGIDAMAMPALATGTPFGTPANSGGSGESPTAVSSTVKPPEATATATATTTASATPEPTITPEPTE